MKSLSVFLGFAVIAAVAAGCSGGSTGSPSSFVPGAKTEATRSAARARRAQLMVPLSLNGKRFSVGRAGSCRNVSISSASIFTAPRSHHFTLKSSITLAPSCARFAGKHTALFIAAANVDQKGTVPLTPLAGPVNPNAKPWIFTPISTGVAMKAKGRFAFFVVAVPSDETTPTPDPGAQNANFKLLAPVNFNGTSFAQPTTCSNNVQDAPVYTASSNGPLTLSATVTISPTCAPGRDDGAKNAQLYVVALPAATGDDGDRSARSDGGDDGDAAAVAVAGPANAADAAWNFAPDSPGLTLQTGAGYAFFIAAAEAGAPATPAPPRSYHAVLPLNFDGTAFTSAAIGSCGEFANPLAFTPGATAPLTLAGPVTIVPACVPSRATPLYVVATVADFESGSDIGVRKADDGSGDGPSIDGIAIAGPVLSSDASWSFTPLAPALTLTQGLQYRFYVAARDSNS